VARNIVRPFTLWRGGGEPAPRAFPQVPLRGCPSVTSDRTGDPGRRAPPRRCVAQLACALRKLRFIDREDLQYVHYAGLRKIGSALLQVYNTGRTLALIPASTRFSPGSIPLS
jgi:hypothetical protein